MRPLRPTAIATPGATASSSAVLTILSSTAGSAVSSPELLSPIWGGTYLMGAGVATTLAGGVGVAQEATAAMMTRRERERVPQRCLGIREGRERFVWRS